MPPKNMSLLRPLVSNDTYSYMDEDAIDIGLKCKLCVKPFVDPVATQNGDRFCRRCIERIIRQNHQSDEEPQSPMLPELTPVTERIVLMMLDSLLVRCTKCGKTNIMRGQLEDHENKECTQAIVLCTAADVKCDWTGTREELPDHTECCKFEPLRTALLYLFHDHTEYKLRIESLEARINKLAVDNNVQA